MRTFLILRMTFARFRTLGFLRISASIFLHKIRIIFNQLIFSIIDFAAVNFPTQTLFCVWNKSVRNLMRTYAYWHCPDYAPLSCMLVLANVLLRTNGSSGMQWHSIQPCLAYRCSRHKQCMHRIFPGDFLDLPKLTTLFSLFFNEAG